MYTDTDEIQEIEWLVVKEIIYLYVKRFLHVIASEGGETKHEAHI